ncbi:MAG TPA: TraR/DksA C4-type zinc finger protein [Acidimicrobiales bacterium]|nr:TraR/DksA C4-type zinc finger protein [Acidimicrobiales bacterium]
MEYERSPGRDESDEIDEADVVAAEPAVDTVGVDLDIELLESIEQELADVELALERLGDGSYGLCETCGGALGEDELEAGPARRFCRAHLPVDSS